MSDHYDDGHDLARFPDIGKNAPDLAKKFFERRPARARVPAAV